MTALPAPTPHLTPAPANRTDGAGRVWAVVLLGAAARLALAAALPLTNDEAYYADWARHLQPGYLDHPPAVAWLVAAGLKLLPAHPLAVRLPSIVVQTVAALLAASLARARGGARAALTTAIILQAALVFSIGAALALPDAPLALAWVGTLWAVERAARRGPAWMLAAGFFLGLGALSKLTAGLLGVAVLAALVATPDGRRVLRTPWPWLGAVVAAAGASPMLLWNAAHGWPSFTFQASHGLSGREFSVARLAASIGGQLAYVSPVLLVLAAGASLRPLWRPRGLAEAALAFSALPVVLFFTAAASVTPGALPHWPAPGWLSALLLLGASPTADPRWIRRGVWVGLGELAVGLAAVAVLFAVPVPDSIDLFGRRAPVTAGPFDDFLGWREGARAARAVAGDARLGVAHWIAVGQLGFADGRSPAYLGERVSGPTFYDPDPLAAGGPLLVVTIDGLGPQRERLEQRMGPLLPAGVHEARQGERLVRTYRFWWWKPPLPGPGPGPSPSP
jgi:4-amino-4-deoxy-L-arabinose transferase-like glycosyltransferase